MPRQPGLTVAEFAEYIRSGDPTDSWPFIGFSSDTRHREDFDSQVTIDTDTPEGNFYGTLTPDRISETSSSRSPNLFLKQCDVNKDTTLNLGVTVGKSEAKALGFLAGVRLFVSYSLWPASKHSSLTRQGRLNRILGVEHPLRAHSSQGASRIPTYGNRNSGYIQGEVQCIDPLDVNNNYYMHVKLIGEHTWSILGVIANTEIKQIGVHQQSADRTTLKLGDTIRTRVRRHESTQNLFRMNESLIYSLPKNLHRTT